MPELFGVEYQEVEYELFSTDDMENYMVVCDNIRLNDIENLAYEVGNCFLQYNIKFVEIISTEYLKELDLNGDTHPDADTNDYHYYIDTSQMLRYLDPNIVRQIFAKKHEDLDNLLVESIDSANIKSARNV